LLTDPPPPPSWQIWSKDFQKETRLWASLRAQTLARTVEGMMYYEEALKVRPCVHAYPRPRAIVMMRAQLACGILALPL
jgi:hypothetical protein